MTKPPWELALQDASIRGVVFQVESRDETGGHNVATHEYIDSDDVYSENTGRKADGWSVDGYLWGDDYLDQRTKLRKALKQRGAAEYVDRWGGRYWVHIRSWGLRETRREGGWVTVRLDLVEAGTDTAPSTTLATQQVVETKADAALPSVLSSFTKAFNTSGPSLLADDAASMLAKTGGQMSDVSTSLASTGRPLVNFQRGLGTLTGGASGLVGTPSVLAGSIQSAVGSLVGLGGLGSSGTTSSSSSSVTSTAASSSATSSATTSTASAAATSYSTAMTLTKVDANWDTVPETTTTRKRQAANRRALAALIRQLALLEAARAVASMTWANYDQAVATRSELGDALTSEIRRSDDDALKAALRALLAAVVRDITIRGADLTKLSEVTVATTLPALVVAHTLLGDATRAGDILAWNPSIKDPMAVPGGKPIKVAA